MSKKSISVIAVLMAFVMLTVPAITSLQSEASDPHEEFMKSLNIHKVEDYLYDAEYSDYDYEEGEKFAKEHFKPSAFGCSALSYESKIIGRNFDFFYKDNCDFIVKTPNANGRYATICDCNFGSTHDELMLKNDFVASGEYSELYEYLPFFVLDGMNEKGLFVETNLNTSNHGQTTGTNPGKPDLCILTAARYILDNAANVKEAVEIFKSHNMYAPGTDMMKSELHFMIADGKKTVEVEFVENKVVVLEDVKVVTNFALCDEKPYEYSHGIERYNLLLGKYTSVGEAENKVRGMMDAMRSANFTQLYSMDTDPKWYSDICGVYKESVVTLDLKVEAWYNDDGTIKVEPIDKDKFVEAMEETAKEFEQRQRGDHTWQTVHTCVYDLENKTLHISVQENENVYHYSFDKNDDNSTIYIVVVGVILVAVLICAVFFAAQRFRA